MICMIRPSLDILDVPYSSKILLTLELLLPPSGTTIDITILGYTIFSIPYISQVPPTSPMSEIFPIDTLQNIYIVAIDYE